MPGGRYPWAVRAGGPLLKGSLPILISWNPESAQEVPATRTFFRGSIAHVLTTTDGATLWYQEAKSGEIRMEGLRRVENLLDSSTGTGPFTAVAKDGRLAVSVIASNGTLTITIGGTPQVFTPTGTPQRFVAFDDATGGSTSVAISGTATLFQPMAHLCQVGNDIPEPYIQHDAEFLNIGVNGVSYFDKANTSIVAGNGVVTPSTGPVINGGGYLSETTAINQMPVSDIGDNGNWSREQIIASDNGINSLGLQEAVLDAGTDTSIHRTFDAAATSSANSSYVIGRAGTGRYIIIRCGGADNDYACFDLLTGTVTEEAAGIDGAIITDLTDGYYKCEISTSDTDATFFFAMSDTGTPGTSAPSFPGANLTVLISQVQREDTPFSTSPIITDGAPVTRQGDILLTGVNAPVTGFTALVDATGPDNLDSAGASTVVGQNISEFQPINMNSVGGEFRSSWGTSLVITGSDWRSVRRKVSASLANDQSGDDILSASGETSVTGLSTASDTGEFTFGVRSSDGQFRGIIHFVTIYDENVAQDRNEELVV